jgi:ribosomal protein S7
VQLLLDVPILLSFLASEGNPDSYAVGKKEELERQAEAAHN